MCNLLKRDRNLQIAVAQELGMAIVTIYQWAKYYPERLAKNPAALKVIVKHMKKDKKKEAKAKLPVQPEFTSINTLTI